MNVEYAYRSFEPEVYPKYDLYRQPLTAWLPRLAGLQVPQES